jgi:DNA modification methylase
MEINQIYNTDFLTNSLPNKCANLIIADPPYYKVKGKFDFVWNTFDDYLKDVEKWCIECKRLLADNGTLFWYGSAKNIAYAQVIFDKHFNLINNLVWNKGSFMGLEESDGLRSFAPCTERILMYENKEINNPQRQIEIANNNIFEDIRIYFINQYSICQKNGIDINLFLPKTTNFHYVAKGSAFNMPSKQSYVKLQKTGFFKKPYNELKLEYDNIKKHIVFNLIEMYNEERRPFNNVFKLQEVFNFLNEATQSNKYAHDTVKPTKLTRMLIQTCSRENDLVVVPFVGSGTECAMSVIEKRNFVGFESEKEYYEMANDRIQKAKQQLRLF